MSYTATGWHALALRALVGVLAGTPAWQTVTGAIDATAAQDFIVLGDGGKPGEGKYVSFAGNTKTLAAPLAVVDLSDQPATTEQMSLRSWRNRSPLEMALFLPLTPGDTPLEAYERALDTCDAVLTAVRGAANSGILLATLATLTRGPRLIAPGEGMGRCFHALITIESGTR